MTEKNVNVEPQLEEQEIVKVDQIFLNSTEFSGLLNLLLINTKFFVATEVKETPEETPEEDSDVTVYLVNILVNNPVINVKSDLIQLLSKYSNNVQIINNPDLTGYHTVGVEVYVKSEVKEEVKELEVEAPKKKPARKKKND